MAGKIKKGSETVTIMRSQIQMNPANIKRHSSDDVKRQKKNLREVGFLGGIVWNAASSRLIDGHRRIEALDLIHKYDGSPETDYEVKVERVEFDDKTEKQQMAYMALGNTKTDYNLVANIIDDIDYRDVGLSDDDYRRIRELAVPDVPEVGMSDYDEAFISSPVTELDDTEDVTSEDIEREHAEKPKMTKDQVKAEKRHCDDVASKRQEEQDLYVFLTFSNLDAKFTFCELLGVPPANSMMVKGEDVLGLIE